MMVRSYRDLEVWQKAMDLVVLCYSIADSFPRSETYGLSNQLQRAVVSVPASVVIATFEGQMQAPCGSHAIRTLVPARFPRP